MSSPDSLPVPLDALSINNPSFPVNPLFWTQRHLLFVNCVFQELYDQHRDVTPREDHDEHLTTCAQELATDPSAVLKRTWVEDLLTRPGGQLSHDNHQVGFFYDKRRVLKIWCDVFRPAENTTLHDALIGYHRYDVDQQSRNRRAVRPPPDDRRNDPVKRFFEREFQRLRPGDWRNDPFIACILISLAQRLVRDKQQANVYLTRLLVTYMSDQTHAYIFKADVPHEVLECFDQPARAMDDVAFPTIQYTAVPFQPYSTFSERIELHLLSAGDAGPVTLVLRSQKRETEEADEPASEVQKQN